MGTPKYAPESLSGKNFYLTRSLGELIQPSDSCYLMARAQRRFDRMAHTQYGLETMIVCPGKAHGDLAGAIDPEYFHGSLPEVDQKGKDNWITKWQNCTTSLTNKNAP